MHCMYTIPFTCSGSVRKRCWLTWSPHRADWWEASTTNLPSCLFLFPFSVLKKGWGRIQVESVYPWILHPQICLNVCPLVLRWARLCSTWALQRGPQSVLCSPQIFWNLERQHTKVPSIVKKSSRLKHLIRKYRVKQNNWLGLAVYSPPHYFFFFPFPVQIAGGTKLGSACWLVALGFCLKVSEGLGQLMLKYLICIPFSLICTLFIVCTPLNEQLHLVPRTIVLATPEKSVCKHSIPSLQVNPLVDHIRVMER